MLFQYDDYVFLAPGARQTGRPSLVPVDVAVLFGGEGVDGDAVGGEFAEGDVAVDLLSRTEAGSTPVRLIGVGLGGLSQNAEPEFEQLEFELK